MVKGIDIQNILKAAHKDRAEVSKQIASLLKIEEEPVFIYLSRVKAVDYCSRCGGAGGSDKWHHTGWTCFKCGGDAVFGRTDFKAELEKARKNPDGYRKKIQTYVKRKITLDKKRQEKQETERKRQEEEWAKKKAEIEAKEKEQVAKLAKESEWYHKANSWFIEQLEKAYQGNFVTSILDNLTTSKLAADLPDKALNILSDIIGKVHGRSNSKAYLQAIDEFNQRIDNQKDLKFGDSISEFKAQKIDYEALHKDLIEKISLARSTYGPMLKKLKILPLKKIGIHNIANALYTVEIEQGNNDVDFFKIKDDLQKRESEENKKNERTSFFDFRSKVFGEAALSSSYNLSDFHSFSVQ